MRERDFEEVALQDGISPAWPLDYAELEPYYQQAEQLYRVHGKAGVDPTEPKRKGDFLAPPKPIEPFLEPLRGALQRQGCQPYDIPISWSDDADDPSGDAQLFGLLVRPWWVNPNGSACVTTHGCCACMNPNGRAIGWLWKLEPIAWRR